MIEKGQQRTWGGVVWFYHLQDLLLNAIVSWSRVRSPGGNKPTTEGIHDKNAYSERAGFKKEERNKGGFRALLELCHNPTTSSLAFSTLSP